MNDFKIRSVLLPTDFSNLNESALQVAISICKRQSAKLTLFNVIDNFEFLSPVDVFVPVVTSTSTVSDVFKTIEDNIKELAIRLSHQTQVDIQGITGRGNPGDEICSLAAQYQFDLIVMGTHGAAGLREFFIGSNAFRVVKNAPCPVLTIPGNWNRTEFKKVIFPIRIAPGAIDKYNYARQIIKKNNSKLIIIGFAGKDQADALIKIKILVNEISQKLNEDNIDFSSLLYQSDDFPSIIKNITKNSDADLIIVTANLDYQWKEFFIGPFVQQIVNHSKVPVLSIKPELTLNEPKDLLQKTIEEAAGRILHFGLK